MGDRHSQRGAALLVLLTVALLGMGFLGITLFSPSAAAQRSARITSAVLAQAKTALILAAASRGNQPGALPCPDIDNDGVSDVSGSICAAYLGRLPWRTLGLAALKDGDGECLWYGLSPDFRNALAPASRSATQRLNDALPGQIQVMDSTGIPLPAPNNPAIAVIFSPGAPLPGQDRSPTGTAECLGNLVAANYLDSASGFNNAAGGTSVIAASPGANFNDRLEWITGSDLFAVTNKRVLNTLRGSIPDSLGLAYYFRVYASYPFAASPATSGNAIPGALSGTVPYADLAALAPFDSTTNTWLQSNNWYSRIIYSVSQPGNSMTLTLGSASVTCGSASNACP